MAKLAIVVPMRSTEKHPSNPIATEQRFLNFGALALATFCQNHGHEAIVIDEYTLNGGSSTDAVEAYFGADESGVIGISCISAYSADRARVLVASFRQRFPKALIAIGGQHFAGLWQQTFPQRIPGIDILIANEAEQAMTDILDLVAARIPIEEWNSSTLRQNVWWSTGQRVINGALATSVASMDSIVIANYALYPGSANLFPSIEFSRGCKYACVFCANSTSNRRNFRRVGFPALRQAIDTLARTFERDTVQFYLQASDFVVTLEEAQEMAASLSCMPHKAVWRTEIRVDEMSPSTLEILADCGLSYLDIGLESASPSTLRVMNKTNNPDAYLRKAEALLTKAREVGIFTKVNFLIHPGDTRHSVAQSKDWLLARKHLIDGISSGVTLEYPGTPLSLRLPEFTSKYGTNRKPHELSSWGVYNLDPSSELRLQEAEILAREIAQEMQTREDFLRSKSFGYLGSTHDAKSLLRDLPEADHTTPYS